LIDRFNIDNVCWESDSPHSDTDWPNAPEVVAEVMAPLNDEQIAKVTPEIFKVSRRGIKAPHGR